MVRWKPDPEKSERDNEWDALMAAGKAFFKKHKGSLKADEGTYYDLLMDTVVKGYDVLQELKERPDYQPEKYTLFNSAYYAMMWGWQQAKRKNFGAHKIKKAGTVYDTYVQEENARDTAVDRPVLSMFGNELVNKLNYMSECERQRRVIMKNNREKGRKQQTARSVIGLEIIEEESGSQYLDYVDDCAEFGIKPLSREEFERGRLARKLNPSPSA